MQPHMVGRVSHSVIIKKYIVTTFLVLDYTWRETLLIIVLNKKEWHEGSDNKWFSLVLETVSVPLSMRHRHNQQWHNAPKSLQWLQHLLIHQSSRAYLHREEKEYKIMEQSCQNWGGEIGQKACNWGYNSLKVNGLSKISTGATPALRVLVLLTFKQNCFAHKKAPHRDDEHGEGEDYQEGERRQLHDPASWPVCLFEWRSPEPASVYPESRDVR